MLRLLLWPVTMYVNLVGLLLRLMGRAVGFCVGLVLAALGGLLCCTISGAVVGSPLGLVGLGMMFKCFW